MGIRKSLAILFMAVTTTMVSAQKVDTMQINGESYYVYPFRVSVNVHNDYFQTVNMDDLIEFTFKHYGKEISSQFGEELSLKEFKIMMKAFNPKNTGYGKKKYINKKFIKAVRKNPYPLLEQDFDLNRDIIPSLDPIPDGKYVQLYESFCLVDSKGHCQDDTPRIAGYFTIKNNMLEGDAYWLNMKGDTLKYGKFEGGQKAGEWVLMKKDLPFSLNQKIADAYINNGSPLADTVIAYYNYVNGARNGVYKKYVSSAFPVEEGVYTDDEKTGEWLYREVQFKGQGKNRKRIRDNNLVTLSYTLTSVSDTIVTKKPWIRNGLIDTYSADVLEFNFISRYTLESPPRNFFSYNFSKDEDLDLEEEQYGSYQMDSYSEEEYYDEYGFEGEYMDEYGYDYGYYSPQVYDKGREEYFKRSYVVDSIGLIANYKGVYEAHYPNGQLVYRYNVKDGVLLAEDTIFWDNGNAHDVISFVEDSNQYMRSIYDYDGKLFKELIYDSIGEFVRVGYEYDSRMIAYLEGFKAVKSDYGDFYSYDVDDTLKYDLEDKLVLFRSWFVFDSSRLFNIEYDPEEHVVTGQDYAVTGKIMSNYKRKFSEDFESWTGVDTVRLADITFVTTSSGALYEGEYYHDSIPQRNVRNAYNRFDVADEYVLYMKGVEYTGPAEIQFNSGKLKVSSGNLSISLPQYKKTQESKFKKRILKYKKNGKGSRDILLNYIDASDIDGDIGSMIYYAIFNDMLQEFFYYPEAYGDYFYEYEESYGGSGISSIKGYMVDGKPHGLWKAYDSKGKLMLEVPFEKGAAHGTVKQYDFAYPRSENNYYYDYVPEALIDSAPPKKTYYLSMVSEYKNGQLDGKETTYNWMKEVVSETNYREGMRDGLSFERNKLAYTRINYKDDVRDGYMQTYLTLPGKDSILLYDLNFQNGMLQGESRSYHMNGQLAKRGFFLDGEPIDDYEAYDSLGFRYHYVKFKYSYPVEEKIWEENELSVRYLFDWQDSIYFVPSDITTSQSLEKVLYNLGFGQEYLARPYYGRPSLVNKKGVKYHMTKYFPNDTIARDGELDDGKKVGQWKFYNYDGEFLYEADYFDTVIVLNDSIRFHVKGILTDVDPSGNELSKSYIIEKFEKYDCSHTDHYEIRQFYTISEASDTLGRMNGYVKNYYDNGVLQSEGQMKDGLPVGFWKIYDPFGKLNQYGQYVLGKRDGRWLSGDLSKTKYLGDICLNPNLPDLEKEIEYRENLLDIVITNYKLGKSLNKQYYDVNMNRFKDVEEDEGDDTPPPSEDVGE